MTTSIYLGEITGLGNRLDIRVRESRVTRKEYNRKECCCLRA